MSETVKYKDLVKTKGLYYQKSSDVPFTGTSTGERQGKIKKGKKVGPWVWSFKNMFGKIVIGKATYKDGKFDGLFVQHYDNGQLKDKVTFKDGKPDGPYVEYWDSGRLAKKLTYKDGNEEGPWISYYHTGQLFQKGTYKDGNEEGPWVNYHSNGQLDNKGTYKDDKREGPWVFFHSDGTKRMSGKRPGTIFSDEGSGFYRNGKKVSD